MRQDIHLEDIMGEEVVQILIVDILEVVVVLQILDTLENKKLMRMILDGILLTD